MATTNLKNTVALYYPAIATKHVLGNERKQSSANLLRIHPTFTQGILDAAPGIITLCCSLRIKKKLFKEVQMSMVLAMHQTEQQYFTLALETTLNYTEYHCENRYRGL
ncbi:uncharacterized protein PHALS_09516 [Plasmopara halstedii]|uniref:Uncharacterized protein n=1 Tax=Plasmopara halstedii TaxID=4781 RepID=A0A0P1A4J9_PLAHL|nr:uncharacterized protein PHALS_09516 [Plasmopara halstedii]CEG35394.1 hypothetical protein PHALS_09516 [Plasmopara halstedii]|eukprot:XP_024571763.1 hypothetical protein PHALS_09516 [Plasmopara halstedii]